MPIEKFVTDTGIEVPSVSSAQMKEIDRIAMEETGPNLYQMMENAGRNVAKLTLDVLGKRWEKADICILAGYGGNGGGGICSARHLANRNARVYLCLSNPEKTVGVPAEQQKLFQQTSGQEISLEEIQKKAPDLIIDALIGYSLQGSPRGNILRLIQWANVVDSPVLSLDMPSGLEATDGLTPGEYVSPTWTLTLALPKSGLLPVKSGALFLADIGIPESTYAKAGIDYKSPFDYRYRIPIFPK